MRVLWFTGVQFPAITGDGLKRAAWQEGIRQALEQYYPELELGIASFGSNHYQPFQKGNAKYFNILRSTPSGKIRRILRAWKHKRTFDQNQIERCLSIVDEYNPDLILIWGAENPFGLLSNQFTVPTIMSIQGVTSDIVNRLFDDFTWNEIAVEIFSKKFISGGGLFHRWWTFKRYTRIEQLIYKRCDAFEGRTTWDYKWLRRFNSKAPYFHIDSVLAAPYYESVWAEDKAQSNVIYTTSSNASFKGAISLIKAMIELKIRGRKNIKLRLAGVNNDSKVGRIIERNILEYELDGQVSLLGRITPEQIIQEIKSASAFVYSSHADNSPNSLAEAMLMGIPCVSSDVGGVPSMLENGSEGLTYPHQDFYALADKIEQILDDRDQAIKYGIAARKTALHRHDPKRLANATIEMYRQCLNID